MSVRRRSLLAAAAVVVVVAACGSGDEPLDLGTRQTTATSEESLVSSPSVPSTVAPSTTVRLGDGADVAISIDASARGGEISPLILGLSSTLTADEFNDLGVRLNSWGGNPSTRYNYMIGHAWNHGSDYEFRNTNYGSDGDASRGFLQVSEAAGIDSRVAVPALGWVARNDDEATCSFPDGAGGCQPASEVGNCADPGPVADPERANVRSTAEGVAEWIRGLIVDGHVPRFLAVDNEPELWGHTHYDVHPECPTYEEILDTYLTYARALRDVAPDSQLSGPVMCCWYDYWDTAPGPADGPNEDFLEWFLRNVQEHDAEFGRRTLDIVDVHFYPQSEVFNDKVDPETSARRLRSTRALWDPEYDDESWIDEHIRFIPRIKEVIERSYPGTPLMISEWNFGAEDSLNGAVAIAEVLGIYGREGVDAAAYWRNPPVGSPGYFAFKMHGNYDDRGARFGGERVTAESSDRDEVSAYAAVDEAAGLLRVMLINKDPDQEMGVELTVAGFDPQLTARRYTYGPDDLTSIVAGTANLASPVALPPYSITVLELTAA